MNILQAIDKAIAEANDPNRIQIREDFRSLIPALHADELAQLESNIVAEGCRDPIVLWEDTIVDGHNRFEICRRRGVKFNTAQIEFADDDHARLWIRFNQLGRRNLTDDQRAIIADAAAELESKLARSEQAREAGKKSGASRRGETNVQDAAACTFEQDKDRQAEWTRAKLSKRAKVSERKMKKARAVRKKSGELASKVERGEMTLDAAAKEIRAKEIAADRAKVAEAAAAVKPSDRFRVHWSDMRTWKADKQYDLIITDPPYPREYLLLYDVLAMRALDWLKDGGLLVAMCGQSYLDEIYVAMSKHLKYYWTGCYLTQGQPTPLRQVNVNTTWKPLLIYAKGEYTGKIFGDVFKSEANDKDFHKWGQSVSGMIDIVQKLTIPGQSILDPFCGAGTTGIAALKCGCLFDGVETEKANVDISISQLNDASL